MPTPKLLLAIAFLLPLLLALPAALRAQPDEPATVVYRRAGHRLMYPRTWLLRQDVPGAEATFTAPGTGRAVPGASLTVRRLPSGAPASPLTAAGAQDSLWRGVRRLSRAQVLRIEPRVADNPFDLEYDYTYAPAAAAAARTHVVGRWLRRGAYELRLEYRGDVRQDGRYLAEAQQLVASLAFTAGRPAAPSDSLCDNKMYGIAAMRRRRGHWEDDCRTIHEFSREDPSSRPVMHRQVLPFQSYALAKGFDNCLYSVTKAPTDAPEYVYRYNPATRRGAYTAWQLPAQGPDNIWISASTGPDGALYFLSSDANRLVKVHPNDGVVTLVWNTDPTRLMPYYPAVAFAGAGTHGNFCLDDGNTLFMVYSTDGALLRVDLRTGRASPDLVPLDGLPRRGGYSDILLQNDPNGRRLLYLAGPRGIYQVNMARHRASLFRKGTYTDLAGCNLFKTPLPPVPAVAAAVPGAPATTAAAPIWRGRVLDSGTYRPLPQAQLRLGLPGAEIPVTLTPQGTFACPVVPGASFRYHAQFAGYLPTDSTGTLAGAGPLVRDVLLRPLIPGATLRLDKVQFAQGQAVLLPSSFPDLNQLMGLMRLNPRMTIELHGHTDNVGAADKNVALSEQRVATVKAYLVSRGVVPPRVAGIGFGGARPLADNAREATRQLNRRVEVRVTAVW